MIGSGSFGHVHIAKHAKTGKECAVKKFKNKFPTKKKAFE
jgi:serine/threonine protein kinase